MMKHLKTASVLLLVALFVAMVTPQGTAAESPPTCRPRGAGATCAVAVCGVGFADAKALAVGSGADARTSADVVPLRLTAANEKEKNENHAYSTSTATGDGIGVAAAYASAGGVGVSSSCPLLAGPAFPPSLAVPHGCMAHAGDAAALYDGALLVDPLTGAAWLVGSVERGGAAAPFAAPVGGGLILTATHASSIAPPLLEDSGLRLRVEFSTGDAGSACQSALTG